MECRLNGVVKELIRTIRVCRRQLLFLSVLGDKESLGESSESSEWFALISFFFFCSIRIEFHTFHVAVYDNIAM